MRDLPLNALRAFASVYLMGGIRPAGRSLGVAHSAVARHVTELEALVGAPLIERGGTERALAFTPLGERLGREASKTLGSLEKTWLAARERRPPNAVIISAVPSVAALWLLPRLPQLAEAYPGIEISVLAEQRVRGQADEGCDLSIRMGKPQPGERAIPFMDDALTPVSNPDLFARLRLERSNLDTGLSALLSQTDVPLLHDRDPNAGWSLWTDSRGPIGRDLASGPRFSSSDLVLRAAKQSQGIALARLRLAQDDLAAGTLIRLSDHNVRLPDAYWIIISREREDRAAVRLVREWLFHEGKAPVSVLDGHPSHKPNKRVL
ncbi:LysR substrate-binding domain-containing protein [Ahrensia sp. R2A130]|uniref:LysR substrate-binding domain-containing protein n=1 Tax=Ahrensia sp. R2A130 TaxID=744979 RepID=UPI000682370C|nr:LysR substrate-binding domain-containing protein [Ahrensia sp. R2A130]